MKKLFQYICTIIICSLVGFFLLVITYKFSNFYAINNNAYNSGEITNGKYNQVEYDGGPDSYLDSYTDSLMVSTSAYEGNYSPIISAASSPRKIAKTECLYQDTDKYKDERNHIDTCLDTTTYERYWHGYQILLRPLLRFFTYQEILKILSVVYFVLLLSISVLMVKTSLTLYIVPLIISVITMNFSSLTQSLQYSTTTITTFIFLIIMLFYINKQKTSSGINNVFYRYLFLIFGCTINFFDLLTFPIFGVGMLSVLYIVINKDNNYKEVLKNLLINVLLWCFGYATMWIMRWLSSSLILGKNVFDNALVAALFRVSTSYNGQEFTVFDTVVNNVNRVSLKNMLINIFYILLILLTNYKLIIKKFSFKGIVAFAVCFLMPFVWWIVLRNHTAIHSTMTFKGIAVSFFAINCYITTLVDNTKKQQ